MTRVRWVTRARSARLSGPARKSGPQDEGAVVAAGVAGARLAPGAPSASEGLVVPGAVRHICLSRLQTNPVSSVTSPPGPESRHPSATPYVASTMKGWAAAVALVAVVAAAALGLWATWDETRTGAIDPLPAPDLVTTTTSGLRPADPTTTVPPAPECTVGSEPVDGDPANEWSTVVIDTGHSLPPDYAPTDLVSVAEAGFATQDQVRSFVIPDLAALRAGAEANGTPMVVVSGYRSYDYQRTLFTRRAADVGEEQAALETARPGHSEHQLGTAVDILDPALGRAHHRVRRHPPQPLAGRPRPRVRLRHQLPGGRPGQDLLRVRALAPPLRRARRRRPHLRLRRHRPRMAARHPRRHRGRIRIASPRCACAPSPPSPPSPCWPRWPARRRATRPRCRPAGTTPPPTAPTPPRTGTPRRVTSSGRAAAAAPSAP